MASKGGPIATIAGQEGENVLLSVPMVGFPAGFRLRTGERVVLITDENGRPAAMPLVKSSVQRGVGRESVSDTEAIDVGGKQATVQSSTIVNEGEGRDLVVWVVDPGTAEGPPQVIATRSD